MFNAAEGAAAPDLLNTEVLHVIRRYERGRAIDAERSREAIELLADLPIVRYPTLSLVERAWELGRNLTAYDAMYAALAEALGMPLVTTDARLATALRAHTSADALLLR